MIGTKTPLSLTRLALAAFCALSFSVGPLLLPASATELPPGVLNYLRQKDPKVRVRFDGMVLFSNGESYVPVIPQDPDLNPESQQVIATLPAKTAYPDLIQFDNNFFLMRLVQTASGRLTFPKMAEYPLQLKEGLLPQDLVMPANLFIPVELKIILGALPYNPNFDPDASKPLNSTAALLSHQNLPESKSIVANRLTYIYDLTEQKILAIEPLTGKREGEVPLNGVPSGLKLSPDGKLLFVPCLSTNELVVIDTTSNLVKTRVPVGQRPDSVLYATDTEEVLVSNRYSPFLSAINANELKGERKIALPGNGGVMALVPDEKQPKLLIADAGEPKIYVVNLTEGTISTTLPAVPDISAMKAFKDTDGKLQIWVASRSQNEVAVLDGRDGRILEKIAVGKKPVDMITYKTQLFVLSAGDARVDQLDIARQALTASIPLSEDSFPSGMVALPSEQHAYITTAGATELIVLNLETGKVEKTIPVNFRASMITTTPDREQADPVIKAMPPKSTTLEASLEKSGHPKKSRFSFFGTSANDTPDSKSSVSRPSNYTGGPTPSGRVSGKVNLLKFGKETKSPSGTTHKNASSANAASEENQSSPAKPGVRFGQPANSDDSGPSPSAMPDMLDNNAKSGQ